MPAALPGASGPHRLPRRRDPRREFTRRYTVALALIASVLVATYAAMAWQTRTSEADGFVINIAGMQRMLSQRIAFLAMAASRPAAAEEQRQRLDDLAAAIERMRSNSAELTGGRGRDLLSPGLVRLYAGAGGIAARVTRYTDAAEARLVALRSHGDDHRAAAIMKEELGAGLLPLLDDAVTLYQRDYEGSIRRFERLQAGFLLLGLAVLAAEAALIFRPMTRRMDSALRDLQSATRDLREFSHHVSHDLRGPVASALGLLAIAGDFSSSGEAEQAADAGARARHQVQRLDNVVRRLVRVISRQSAQDDHFRPGSTADAPPREPANPTA